MSYINPLLGGNVSLGGVQMALAAAYESRLHTFSKMSVPRAQFAGDTAVTLTDGSYNTRTTTNEDIPKSATAQLANTSNTTGQYGKPMVIRALRDSFTAEIYDYAVFNADGTFPGGQNPLVWVPAKNRFEVADATKHSALGITAKANEPRYKVNKATGEIYVNNAIGMREHSNPDGLVNFQGATYNSGAGESSQQNINNADVAILQGLNMVVGMVDFEGLQGGALSSAQQQASELSGIIQSLTSVLRTVNEGKKTTLGLIR